MPGHRRVVAVLCVGASAMFAAMYSTQSVVVEIARGLDTSASTAGLTVCVVVAPSIGVLLACRALQGLLMPGLLTVAVSYLVEHVPPRVLGAATGAYTASLVAGGLLARLVPAIGAELSGWRVGLAAIVPIPRHRRSQTSNTSPTIAVFSVAATVSYPKLTVPGVVMGCGPLRGEAKSDRPL